MRRTAVSALAVGIVVIIVVAAFAGVLYFGGYLSPKKSPQTITFATENIDATRAVTADALNHLGDYNLKVDFKSIPDPAALTAAASNGQVDVFSFKFAVPTFNAIEKGANLVAIGEESTAFLQDLVVSSNVTSFKQLNGTTMAAFQLDGPVLFPPVFASYGENFSKYNINLVVLGDSSVKTQALIAGKYIGAFLDPQDAATVFKSSPGRFHVLGTTAKALPGIGGGIYFANKDWLKGHFDEAVSLMKAVIQSARSAYSSPASWVRSTYNANFTGLDFDIYNSTETLLINADFFSPNMITFTPTLMNDSDYYMFYGHLIDSPGNLNQIYNFTVVKAALDSLGRIQEPAGPYSGLHPLSIGMSNGLSVAGQWFLSVPLLFGAGISRPRSDRDKSSNRSIRPL